VLYLLNQGVEYKMVEMKVFGLFNMSEVGVEYLVLKKVINLNSKLKSYRTCLL